MSNPPRSLRFTRRKLSRLSHHSSYSPERARLRNCSNKASRLGRMVITVSRRLGAGHGLHGRIVGGVLIAARISAHDVVMQHEAAGLLCLARRTWSSPLRLSSLPLVRLQVLASAWEIVGDVARQAVLHEFAHEGALAGARRAGNDEDMLERAAAADRCGARRSHLAAGRRSPGVWLCC